MKDDPANNIIDDTITIKLRASASTDVSLLLRHSFYRSALRTVFDHVYCQIEKLVDNQIADVPDKGLSVKVTLPQAKKSRNR